MLRLSRRLPMIEYRHVKTNVYSNLRIRTGARPQRILLKSGQLGRASHRRARLAFSVALAEGPNSSVSRIRGPYLARNSQSPRQREAGWRRRRDSNPRYAFGAYNGLANRRLQPLGHVSASVIRALSKSLDRLKLKIGTGWAPEIGAMFGASSQRSRLCRLSRICRRIRFAETDFRRYAK